MRLRATTSVLASLSVASGLMLCACGSGAKATTTGRTTSPSTAPSPAVAHHRGVRKSSAPRGPHIGATQSVRVARTTIVVRISSVIDPLHGSGAALSPGMKVVGVMASVHDAGPAGYDGSATSDFSLRSPAGPATPVFVPAGPCQTQVQDFMNAIGAGELRTGCVAFSIPKGQAPVSVRFSPNGGRSGLSRSWLVGGR